MKCKCRSNAKIGVRVDECEGSNPCSREESLAGGLAYTVLNLVCFELKHISYRIGSLNF